MEVKMINKIQLKKTIKYLTNRKYIVTIILFVIWLSIFDKNSVINNLKNRNKLLKLNHEKEFWLEKIKQDSTSLYQLKTDDNNLEKYAREQYLMHKPNEDIFIIVEDE